MALKQKPFIRYNEEKKADTFTIKLNPQERTELEHWKSLLQQPKDSTAMKQLAQIGAKVLLDEKFKTANSIIMNNYRKNKRVGIVDFD